MQWRASIVFAAVASPPRSCPPAGRCGCSGSTPRVCRRPGTQVDADDRLAGVTEGRPQHGQQACSHRVGGELETASQRRHAGRRGERRKQPGNGGADHPEAAPGEQGADALGAVLALGPRSRPQRQGQRELQAGGVASGQLRLEAVGVGEGHLGVDIAAAFAQ